MGRGDDCWLFGLCEQKEMAMVIKLNYDAIFEPTVAARHRWLQGSFQTHLAALCILRSLGLF